MLQLPKHETYHFFPSLQILFLKKVVFLKKIKFNNRIVFTLNAFRIFANQW